MNVNTENEHKEFVANYKKDHKILNLQMKQEFLTEIMNGTKKQEFREIKPTTESKYIIRDAEGYAVEDENRYIEVEEPIEVEIRKIENGYGVVYNGDNGEEVLPIFTTKTSKGVEYDAVMIEAKSTRWYMHTTMMAKKWLMRMVFQYAR